MNKTIMKYSNSLAVMSEPMRLNIISLIGSNGKLRGKDLLEKLDLTQPTLSHHMSVLLGANLITARKEGRCVWYSVNQTTITAISEGIASICVEVTPVVAKPVSKAKVAAVTSSTSSKTPTKSKTKTTPKVEKVAKDDKKDKKKKKKDKDKSKKKKK